MTTSRTEADLLVNAGAVVTMNEAREVIMDGAVAIADGRIVAVGKAAQVAQQVRAEREIDARDGLLTPGLIDAHNHPQDSLLSGLLDDVGDGLARMSTYVLPYEHGISDDEAYVAAQATFAQMLLGGTTCFCDAGGPTPDGVARAAVDSGIRGIIARRGNDLPGLMQCPVAGDAGRVVDLASETVDRWDGAAGGRLRARFSLDLPANVTDELCTAMVERATERGVGIVGHLVGRAQRWDPVRERRNADVERYESLGVLVPGLLLAHIGWIHDDDVAAFARHDVKAVHCPSQSMFGATGVIAHGVIPELVDTGVMVGLGTDAACISRFLDLVRVMYLAACAHKDARMDPLAMGAHKAFEMATVDGARALDWEHEIGSLEHDKRADMVVFDTSGLQWRPNPLGNPVADLVYSATGQSARTVIIDGRVVVDDGTLTTINVGALARRVDEVTPAVLDRLGFASAPSGQRGSRRQNLAFNFDSGGDDEGHF